MKQSIKKILLAALLIGLIIILSHIFRGSIILPQVFHVGSISLRFYGLIMALAIAGAYVTVRRRQVVFKLSYQEAENLIFWTIFSGFIGARLYHVMSSFGYYVQNPADIFKFWHGGLSIYGAVGAGLLAIIFFSRAKHLKFNALNILDWLTPGVIVGQIIGRFGNLFNYEAYGYPTSLPWGMYVPAEFRPASYVSNTHFHPWFLYEILLNVLILFTILLWEKRQKLPSGSLFTLYLLMYNIGRFFLENIRIDSTWIGHFRLNSIISLLLVFLCGTLFLYRIRYDTDKIP